MCCVMDARIRLVRWADFERRGGESRLIAVTARDLIRGGCEAADSAALRHPPASANQFQPIANLADVEFPSCATQTRDYSTP